MSTWCGTAARMVVAGTENFLSIDHIHVDPRVHIESLDASEAWPPFLRPGVLAGHDVYERWEVRSLHEFFGASSTPDSSVAHMLGSLLSWTDMLRSWRPADGALQVLAGRPWRHPAPARLLQRPASADLLRSLVLEPLLNGVEASWRPTAWPAGLTDRTLDDTPVCRRDGESIVGRYLATRLMASWVTYQGQGLRSVVASLVSALVLVTLSLQRTQDTPATVGHLTCAIRASDWLLLHLLERQVWADWCSDWEVRPDASPLLELVAGADALLNACGWAAGDPA